MKHNEQYIKSKLEEMKEAYASSNENATFTYDLMKSKFRNNLTIECEAYDNTHKFSIDLDSLKGKIYLNDEFLYEEEFASIESALDHIEETIGVYEKKIHKSFDKFVNEKKEKFPFEKDAKMLNRRRGLKSELNDKLTAASISFDKNPTKENMEKVIKLMDKILIKNKSKK